MGQYISFFVVLGGPGRHRQVDGAGLQQVAAGLKYCSDNVLGDLEKRMRKAKKELEKWRRELINDLSTSHESV